MTDRLAIGVCTYNRGPALADTLRSLAALDPTGGRVTRIVVIDNNCTDGTPELVAAAATQSRGARGLPIELIREPRQGLSAAREAFFRHTDEPLLAFVDDDCLADRAFAAALLARFDAKPRAGAVGPRVTLRFVSPPSRLALHCADRLARQDLGPAARPLSGRDYLVGAGLALRRAALADSGWLERSLLTGRSGGAVTSGEDTEIGVRLRRAGWEQWYEPAAALDHLIPDSRTTPAYLARLIEATSASEVVIRALEMDQPPEAVAAWARGDLARARRNLLRTRLLEPRPRRRLVRLAQRRGRIAGAEQVLRLLAEGRLPLPPAVGDQSRRTTGNSAPPTPHYRHD